MDFRWRSVGDYLRAFDSSGTALNVIQLIGHGTLRIAAMGFARRAPTAAELARMQRYIADGIEDGAWGLSTGLIYAPGSYATTDWVLEGGIDAMLKRLADPEDRARIRRDVEAPAAGQSLLDRIGWENVMVASCTRRKDAEGQRISEIAARRGMDPVDASLELIVDEGGKGYMILFQLDERDLRCALAHPAVMIGSDGSALAPYGELAAGKPHPRSYGTFPRVLGEYAREQRVLTLPQAIHKMTQLPARRLGLKDRGVVAVGARADLVVFDARRVADRATYQEPHQYPTGIEHVLVNGTFVIKDGQHTGSLPGRLLTPP